MKSLVLFSIIIFLSFSFNVVAQTNRKLLQRTEWKLTGAERINCEIYKSFTESVYTVSFRSSSGNVDVHYPYILSKNAGTKNQSFAEQKNKKDDMGTFIICENPKSKEVEVYKIIKLNTDSLIMRSVIFPSEVRIGGWQPVTYIAVPEIGK